MKMVHINFSYSRVTYVENVDFSVLASRNRRRDNKNLKIPAGISISGSVIKNETEKC